MNHIFPACEAMASPIRAETDLCAKPLCSSSDIALTLRAIAEGFPSFHANPLPKTTLGGAPMEDNVSRPYKVGTEKKRPCAFNFVQPAVFPLPALLRWACS